MQAQEMYKKKLISAESAAKLVRSNMWVEYGFAACFPTKIDEEIAKRAPELEQVKFRMDWSLTVPKIFAADPNQEHFIMNTYFVTHGMRKYIKDGLCYAIPRGFGDSPRIYREFLKDRIDIAFLTVTPMDKHGYFNFGASCCMHKALCDVAKTVVVEVNESQPWVNGGYDEIVHISEIDYIVENQEHLIAEMVAPEPEEDQIQIARNVCEYLEEGATLQLGLGPIPNMICRIIEEKAIGNLGIHTEMFTEGMRNLIELGLVNGKKKNINKGKVVFGFAGGTRQHYEYLDRNSALAIHPIDYINNPYVVAQNANQFSVNSAIRIDLTGQVDAESIGPVQVSGSGGQLDFTRGAYHSPGGKAFIAIPSSYKDKEGKRRSNIVPLLDHGDVVTDPRNDVSYVATEYGVINLKGRSVWERCRLLISIAHPDFHDYLREEARKLRYLSNATLSVPLS